MAWVRAAKLEDVCRGGKFGRRCHGKASALRPRGFAWHGMALHVLRNAWGRSAWDTLVPGIASGESDKANGEGGVVCKKAHVSVILS